MAELGWISGSFKPQINQKLLFEQIPNTLHNNSFFKTYLFTWQGASTSYGDILLLSNSFINCSDWKNTIGINTKFHQNLRNSKWHMWDANSKICCPSQTLSPWYSFIFIHCSGKENNPEIGKVGFLQIIYHHTPKVSSPEMKVTKININALTISTINVSSNKYYSGQYQKESSKMKVISDIQEHNVTNFSS